MTALRCVSAMRQSAELASEKDSTRTAHVPAASLSLWADYLEEASRSQESVRSEVLEEAAKMCERRANKLRRGDGPPSTKIDPQGRTMYEEAHACAAAIRTLQQSPLESVRSEALDEIVKEVRRAVSKFPTWPTDPLHAVAVLGEEFGELTKAMLQLVYEPHKSSKEEVCKEALQTAAMALRLYASLDRYEYKPGIQHEQTALQSPARVAEDRDLRQKYKAASPEERQRLIHEHDCPRAWEFYNKHALGSMLCPSCFTCGRQEPDPAKWAIKHMELSDMYVCERCVAAIRAPESPAKEQPK